MNNNYWKPFMVFGLIIGLMFFIGMGFFALMFSRGGGPGMMPGGWGPGMGFFWVFPLFGFFIMLFVMFFFFRMMAGSGGPMSGMIDRKGPRFGMTDRTYDPQSRDDAPAKSQGTCPSCETPVQADWKLCPQCGYHLAAA